MRNSLLLLAALVLGGTTAGCSVFGLGETSAEIDGKRFIVQQTTLRFGIDNNELDCTTEHGRLRTSGSRVLLNDVDHGSIQRGDTLLWARDGRVLVNGKERHPTESGGGARTPGR